MKPRGNRKDLIGVVTSDKMDRTIVVRVDTLRLNPRYKKYIRSATFYKAHDENNEAKVGDRVRIKECRPLSKTKRWRLIEVVRRGIGTAVTGVSDVEQAR